jgi:hypothetical protein
MSQNSQLVEYYKKLLIIQYNNKPKACAHMQALINSAMVYDTAVQIRDGFNIDTAIGAQLDILGIYLGSDRVVTGTFFTRDYFGYSEYGQSAPYDFNGYIKYTDQVPDVQFRSYRESKQSIFTLNDEEFRLILKLKIIRNNAIPSVKLIDDILANLFGDNVIFTDRQNMTISYIFNEGIQRIVTIAQSEDLIPRPSGVGMSVSFTTDIQNIFAYGRYGQIAPDYAVGYSQYGIEPIGGMAQYG